MTRALLGLALTASMACAPSTPSLRSATVGVAPTTPARPPMTVELDPLLVDDVAALTGELMRARAENPPGNERRVVDILGAQLAAAGIDFQTAPFLGDKRTNLKAVLKGTDRSLGALVLLGHSDVVPADPTEWSTPPFEGALRGGRLIGRGAVDMLSMVALETLTLVALKRADVPLKRDVILLVTGDEEVSGRGTQAALAAWPELTKSAFAITEGGALLESALRPGEDLAAIAVAEKGVLQVTLETKGPSGHGSTPVVDAAPDRLVRAVERVLRRDTPFVITRPTARQLDDIGRAHGGLEAIVLSSPALAATFARSLLDATPSQAALFRDTCALTMLESGLKRNVVPARARATFDCRLLPGTDPHAFRDALLATIDDPRVELTVLEAVAASGSDPDGPVVTALRTRIASELPGAAVATILTKVSTDCRFLRKAGVPCYGFLPARITLEELDAVHGKDEAIRTDELEKGLSRLVDVAAALAE